MNKTRALAWAGVVVLVAVVAAIAAGLAFRIALGPAAQRSVPFAVHAPHGVVATSQPLASQAGLAVLQRGGNAVDAAITAAAVLGVIEPYMTGLGGDMFAILWSVPEGRLVGINASGRSGSLMTRDNFRRQGLERVPAEGAESVTVPGALSGWAALLDRHGTITLAEALEPAIRLAEEGFPVSRSVASEWNSFAGAVRADPEARRVLLVDGERAPRAGEWFANPDLAETMRTIAREGPGAFYGGAIGERIAEHVRGLGGFLAPEDFRRHAVEWVEPLSVPYRGYRLWELPPNGQGIAALEMLRILEPYDLAGMGHNTAGYLHHLIEAKKLAYADLEHFVGDPEAMAVTPEQLLGDEFIEQRRVLLDPDRALTHVDPGDSLTSSETTYLAAADEEGNMLSLINSVAGAFGSGVVTPGTGFVLQNRGVGLSFEEGRANSVGPGRRPFHTIIPGFVTKTGADGEQEPWLSYGIVGGAQQPQAHVQVLLNMLLFDMDVQQALDAPRFRHWGAHRVSFETAIPEAVIDELEAMGHAAQDPLIEMARIVTLGPSMGLAFGGGQAIMRLPRGYVAGSDSRRDGLAAAH